MSLLEHVGHRRKPGDVGTASNLCPDPAGGSIYGNFWPTTVFNVMDYGAHATGLYDSGLVTAGDVFDNTDEYLDGVTLTAHGLETGDIVCIEDEVMRTVVVDANTIDLARHGDGGTGPVVAHANGLAIKFAKDDVAHVQAAVNAAAYYRGSTVYLPGSEATYYMFHDHPLALWGSNPHIVLPSGVSLRGDGMGETVVESGYTSGLCCGYGVDHIGLFDLTIFPDYPPGTSMAGCKFDQVNWLTIRGVEVYDEQYGINPYGVNHLRISECVVHNCSGGIQIGISNFLGHGLDNSPPFSPTEYYCGSDLLVWDCEAYDCTTRGFRMMGRPVGIAGTGDLTDAVFNDCYSHDNAVGFYLCGVDSVAMNNCTTSNCTTDVEIAGGHNVTLYDCPSATIDTNWVNHGNYTTWGASTNIVELP